MKNYFVITLMAMFFSLANISLASSNGNGVPDCCKSKELCCTEGAACCSEMKNKKLAECCEEKQSCCDGGGSCCTMNKKTKTTKKDKKAVDGNSCHSSQIKQ